MSPFFNWIHDLQLEKVDYELYANKVVDYFSKTLMMLQNFELWDVALNRRETNEVNHTLARDTTFFASPHMFIEVSPHITNLISNEML